MSENTATTETDEAVSIYADEPTMTREFCEEYGDQIKAIARNQHKSSSIFEADDVEQAIWMAFASRWMSVRHYSSRKILKIARQAGAEWCKKERLDYAFFQGRVIYTTEEVKRILRESTWEALGPGIDVEGRVDVRAAFASLTKGQRENVFRLYGLKEKVTPAQLVQVSRGVRAITDYLNAHLVTEQKEIEAL